MPRRADVPCTLCGRLLPTYRDSAPTHRRRCGQCIKAVSETWEHGTRAGYRREGCRCDECRAWNATTQAKYAADYRERTGVSLRAKYTRRRPVLGVGYDDSAPHSRMLGG